MIGGDTLRYDLMLERAYRGVVRDALSFVSRHGPGTHNFYITFVTDFPGVDIPEFLRKHYPKEMTIVLEHQFWGLEVDDDAFSVILSFRNQRQRLTIPFLAVTAFADPSVKFGLEFRVAQTAHTISPDAQDETSGVEMLPARPPTEAKSAQSTALAAAATESDAAERAGEVVKLDLFRKK